MVLLLIIIISLQLFIKLWLSKPKKFWKMMTRRIIYALVVLAEIFILIHSQRYLVLFPLKKTFDITWIGFPIGAFILILSLVLIKLSFRHTASHIKYLHNILGYIKSNRSYVLYHIIISTKEELFWRGCVQYLLGNSYLSIYITALLFTLIHLDLKKDIVIMEYFELFFFALVLGLLFYFLHNIYIVIIIHLIRNLGISCIKFALKQ
jgi:membrane protease YdiL (CAAX protease family)